MDEDTDLLGRIADVIASWPWLVAVRRSAMMALNIFIVAMAMTMIVLVLRTGFSRGPIDWLWLLLSVGAGINAARAIVHERRRRDA